MAKTLEQLTDTDEPAMDLIRQWVSTAENQCEILPSASQREAVLLEVQVTTHSTMGAVVYETGGILIDHGWLRFLGNDTGKIYYWPPDSLEWESMGFGYTDLFRWALTDSLAEFYADLRRPTWKNEVAEFSADRCINFFPFLWSSEGSVQTSDRRAISVTEAFDLKVDLLKQLQEG